LIEAVALTVPKFEGHPIYRETRAQELTEALWSHPESPWFQRINMLGESGGRGMATQAAWIRSLLASFVKSFEGPGITIGGLFGAPVGSDKEAFRSRVTGSPFSVTHTLLRFPLPLNSAVRAASAAPAAYLKRAWLHGWVAPDPADSHQTP
jgi:hypothetical protein